LAEKNEIKQQGYAPYKDAKVYVPLNIERDKDAYKTTAEAKNEDCKSVYACLARFDRAEKSAETAWFRARDRALNAGSDITPDDTDAVTTNMKKAWKDAILSPCTCTNGLRFRDTLLTDMNMLETCNKSDTDKQTYADDRIKEYVNQLKSLLGY
jgi:hypothetical protein